MNRPKRAAYREAREALDSLPPYMKRDLSVEIDGREYVDLRTVLALFCHTEQGQRFRRKWIVWHIWQGLRRGTPIFTDYTEGADDFLRAALLPQARGE